MNNICALRSGASEAAREQCPRSVALMNTSDLVSTNSGIVRILVPINANEDSRWGVQYALRRHREGSEVEVILLNIGEPIDRWEVLRFRTQQEIAQFQSERAQAFIEEARLPLVTDRIPCRGLFRPGDVVFSILDVAEELACNEIAMPLPPTGLSSYFSRHIVNEVKGQQRDIPIIVVNRNGISTDYART